MSTPEFEAVLRSQGPRIYTLAVRLMGNATDGEDLAQETFLSAWKHWESFRGEAEAGTWLYRICVNLWKNRVRYEKRRSFWRHFSLNSGSDEDHQPMEIADAGPSAQETLEKTERHGLLRAALGRLEPEDRALLVMREMDDKSYEEIAATLDVPLGTVKSRIARSREKLRDLMKAKSL